MVLLPQFNDGILRKAGSVPLGVVFPEHGALSTGEPLHKLDDSLFKVRLQPWWTTNRAMNARCLGTLVQVQWSKLLLTKHHSVRDDAWAATVSGAPVAL